MSADETQPIDRPPVAAVPEQPGERAAAPGAPAGSGEPGETASEEPGRPTSGGVPGKRGLPWVLTWTVAGSLVPGLGLVAAGRRKTGAAVLGAVAVVLAAIAIWLLTGDILKRGISFAVDPQRLLYLAIAVVVAGLLWAVVVVVTGVLLRREAALGRGQGIAAWVLVAVMVGLVAAPTYAITDYSLVQRDLVTSVFNSDDQNDADAEDAKPQTVAADPWAGTDRINVLLIGSDAGDNREGIRPDTLIVASIQPSSGNTVLFSLPRNLERVPFKKGSPGAEAWPDGYYCADESCLLNAVWTWAEGESNSSYSRFRNPGLKATEDAVSGVLGLEIDTYVMLNLDGFKDFIDAVGGVTLDVHERLPIGGDSEHPWETIGYLEVGDNQKMDGWHALWFARSRWSTSDYDRMRRQRCVIAAVTEQTNPVTVARHFPSIARTLKANMSTGIPLSDLEAWVELATRIQGGTVTSLPFTDDVVASRANPDYDLIRRQVNKALRDSERDAARASATATPSATASASPSASASASASASVSPSASPTPKAEVTKRAGAKGDVKPSAEATDSSDAQDVSEVC